IVGMVSVPPWVPTTRYYSQFGERVRYGPIWRDPQSIEDRCDYGVISFRRLFLQAVAVAGVTALLFITVKNAGNRQRAAGRLHRTRACLRKLAAVGRGLVPNRRQVIVLCIGGAAVVCAVLYPPWLTQTEWWNAEAVGPVYYAPCWSGGLHKVAGTDIGVGVMKPGYIDLNRLVMEIGVLLVLIILMVAFMSKHGRRKAESDT
ncbi:MAG TPA: hypothetical protein VM223_11470, partial [Planctomycetota bacterium]|nr:hypothetical protein [Planctomycetota bacterium]